MQNTNDDIFSWLVAAELSSVSAPQWQQLCQQNQLSLLQIVQSEKSQWLELGLSEQLFSRCQKRKSKVEKSLNNEAITEFTCLTYDSHAYPKTLHHLSQPPCALFVYGNENNLNFPQVSIVGSRHGTANGLAIAQQIAFELAQKDVVVTSGLARGIDAAAHTGAVENGRTIAVLGTGIDVCYPAYNQSLRDEIVTRGGTLLSEFLPGTPPRAHHFPIRNRIVAALSLGVLVIEAKIRSGSLITANLAADLGREVFAVPGNVSHPLSEGVNWLIQQGAKLVTKTEDVLEELSISAKSHVQVKKTAEKALASDPILDSVEYDVTSIDDIASRNNLPVSGILAALLEYELRGIVAAVPGGYIKLRGY